MNKIIKNFKIREIGIKESFDPNIFYEQAPFTQANFYGNWQRNLGRVVRRFVISINNKNIAYFQLIKYPLLLGKSYFYIPYGPVIKDFSENLLIYLKQELKKITKSENAVFIRLDFTPLVPNEALLKVFTKAPFYTYHSANFQPREEWFLSLKKTEDEIFNQMHKNTRYSIRLAIQKGVDVEIITKDFEKYFEKFYQLMSETAQRNSFSLHQKDYYKNIFQNLSKINAFLSVAKYKEKILTIDLIIVFGKVAHYVFSGSSNEERDRLPTYLALWRAICYAKQLNCDYYNFGGIATDNKIYKGWEGLTSFKKKFGGQIVTHSDFFDLVINPFWYYFYNFRKLIRKII